MRRCLHKHTLDLLSTESTTWRWLDWMKKTKQKKQNNFLLCFHSGCDSDWRVFLGTHKGSTSSHWPQTTFIKTQQPGSHNMFVQQSYRMEFIACTSNPFCQVLQLRQIHDAAGTKELNTHSCTSSSFFLCMCFTEMIFNHLGLVWFHTAPKNFSNSFPCHVMYTTSDWPITEKHLLALVESVVCLLVYWGQFMFLPHTNRTRACGPRPMRP